MEFKAVPLAAAEGAILGHNLSTADGRRAFRKGRALSAEDLDDLAALGRETVWVARLEPGDVGEDAAAARIAAAVAGADPTRAGLELSAASTGRVNLRALAGGVTRVELERLRRLNRLPGVTLATLPRHRAVRSGETVATLKILPYALPEAVVEEAVRAALDGPRPVVGVTPFAPRRVGLLLTGSAGARERVERGFGDALGQRLAGWKALLDQVDYVPFEGEDTETRLAAALERLLAAVPDLILLAGETAIMDAADLAPRAIERVGGRVERYGAPVDPGNLLLLAYRGDLPIVGAPGCARSPKTNVVDLVLPRLLVGDRLDSGDLAELGHGGLLDDVPERPLPRSRVR